MLRPKSGTGPRIELESGGMDTITAVNELYADDEDPIDHSKPVDNYEALKEILR